MNTNNYASESFDVVLIGAGIMSATLGILLKQLQPDINIEIFERLDIAAAESSDAWNNAGTGHSAFCELNYTPQKDDGSIDIQKRSISLNLFEESRQLWAYLIQKQLITLPESFIRSIPHMSFVWGEENVQYLKKRFTALTSSHLFKGMQYSEDPAQLSAWMPLVMDGRENNDRLAATRMETGTDVNFGALTRCMFNYLKKQEGVNLHFHHEVRDLTRQGEGRWEIKVRDMSVKKSRKLLASFVFIGAGGGAFPLLEKSGILEGHGFGGFPVSGQWLSCTNPEIIDKHQAKVYGKAAVGSPPMSVPHLDTRIINKKKALLFGPYAGFSTKFLKNGSFLDLPLSISTSNIIPMVAAGIHNIPLTKYLIDQIRQSPEDRLMALKEFVPTAKMEDWVLETAGQRVQVIKKDADQGGILEFGTEIVSAEDGSIAALLGASPGASTAVSIMLNLLKRCFKNRVNTEEWQGKLKEMIPSYGQSLAQDENLCSKIRKHTSEVLGLNISHPVEPV